MKIEISGFEKIDSKLRNLVNKSDVKRSMEKATMFVEGEARKKAPKDTGALRRSITSEVGEEEGNVVGFVFTPLEYAPYVEYGTGLFAESDGRQTPWSYEDDEGHWHTTSGQHPQPFMRPALEENRETIVKIFREGITK